MTPPRPAPPCWFVLLVTVAVALACRWLDSGISGGALGDGHEPPIQLAFWGFITVIAGAIFKGLQVAAKVTLAALSWSVKALWWFATTTANGLKVVGQALLVAAKKSWEFFRLTYDKVLKPAVLKFWRWFDKLRRWLDDTFAPVLKFLKDVKDAVLDFYKTFVRPWLDLIDIARRALRVLSSLGLGWARRLDAKLAALQEGIDRPFRLVLREINKIINVVNRIVTADGLFQRLTLIRSIGRDFEQVWSAITTPYAKPPTEQERKQTRDIVNKRTIAHATADFPDAVLNRGGPHRALIREMEIQWRIYLTPR